MQRAGERLHPIYAEAGAPQHQGAQGRVGAQVRRQGFRPRNPKRLLKPQLVSTSYMGYIHRFRCCGAKLLLQLLTWLVDLLQGVNPTGLVNYLHFAFSLLHILHPN